MSEFWRMTLAISGALTVTALCGWYVVTRVGWAFGLARRGRLALSALILAGLVGAVLARTLGRAHLALAAGVGEFAGMVMLSVVITAVLLLPVELTLWLLRSYRALRAKSVSAEPSSPDRREFIVRAAVGGVATLSTGASIYGTLVGRHDYSVDTVPIRLEKLPRKLDGLTIVQLSDIHVGTFINEAELAAALALVRAAQPDVITLTGDLLDHDPHFAPTLARFTRALGPLARWGVFAIPGNHDHYAGAPQMMRALQESGTEVLFNRHVMVGDGDARIVLAGLDDVAGTRFGSAGPRLDRAFANAPDDTARVLLSHNPAFFPTSRSAADLTLSGHTHGGQISLFINTAALVLRHGLVRGHYAIDGSQLYVNRGFGTAGPPARIGSPPEITKLVLHV